MKNPKTCKPSARKAGLVIQDLSDETLVYDLERDRAHCLNQTAAFVWRHCDGRTPAGDIARALKAESGAPVDERVVWLAIDQLSRNHLLDERAEMPARFNGLNRREVIRALGLTAAVALPVVASIVAPVPAQAATGCASTGQGCASVACCPGCVCSGSPNFICTGSC